MITRISACSELVRKQLSVSKYLYRYAPCSYSLSGVNRFVITRHCPSLLDDDLTRVVNKITSDKDVWLKTMLTEELGLNLEIVGSPIKSALVMFGAFLLGGIIPIMPYFAVKYEIIPSSIAILIAIGMSLTSSFIVGAIKSRMAKRSWIRGGIEMAVLGTGIALVGYGIGSELSKVGIVNVEGG